MAVSLIELGNTENGFEYVKFESLWVIQWAWREDS